MVVSLFRNKFSKGWVLLLYQPTSYSTLSFPAVSVTWCYLALTSKKLYQREEGGAFVFPWSASVLFDMSTLVRRIKECSSSP